MLIGRYVPNLVARPFGVSKDYAQLIYDQTSSPRLDKVLRKWDEENWGSAEQRQQLAYIILVELLAYQFASPVRWIETQDILFNTHDFEHFIEIGPSHTLASGFGQPSSPELPATAAPPVPTTHPTINTVPDFQPFCVTVRYETKSSVPTNNRTTAFRTYHSVQLCAVGT